MPSREARTITQEARCSPAVKSWSCVEVLPEEGTETAILAIATPAATPTLRREVNKPEATPASPSGTAVMAAVVDTL
jgi:hypothetical protein